MDKSVDFNTHLETWEELFINNKVLREETEKTISNLRKRSNETDGRIFPSANNVFRAFRETPIDKIQYVLLGQDPYNNLYKGVPSACGLSFVTENGYINHSLQILSENLNINPREFKDFMTDKGVLLLNSYLTVEQGAPRSHKKIWDEFSKILVTIISRYKPNLTWVLLGEDAKAYRNYIVEGRIVTAIHPAALARRNVKGVYPDYQRLFKELKWI